MLDHPLAKFAALKVGLPVLIGFAGLTAATGTGYVLHQQHETCVSTQRSYDTRVEMIEVFTTPLPTFPSGPGSAANLAIEKRNALFAQERQRLLRSADGRPSC